MEDISILKCPYCGGQDLVEAEMAGAYDVWIKCVKQWSWGQPLYFSVCRSCGSVVRTYVKEPEKLIHRQR